MEDLKKEAIKNNMEKPKKIKQTEIGKIPKEWTIVKLNKISNIRYGLSQPPELSKKGIPMIRATNIKFGKIVNEDLIYVNKNTIPSSRNPYLKEGDILVVRSGAYTGDIALITKKWAGSVAGYDLIVTPGDVVDSQFLTYYLLSSLIQKKYFMGLKVRSAQPHLNSAQVEKTSIPLPSLSEQQKITEILSTVDKAIEKVDGAIEKTERIKKGLLQDLLTKGIGHKEFRDTEIGRIPKVWQIVKLKDISTKFVGGGTPSTLNKKFWNGNIAWMTSAHIRTKDILAGQRNITEEGLKGSSTNLIPKNNLIIATRVGIGKAAINKIDVAISQDLTGVLLEKAKVFPDFLYWIIIKNETKLKSLAQGSTIKGILKEELGKISFPLPNIFEQQKIAEILGTVDGKLELSRKRKEKLERIKKGLMNDLLTGKKRVKSDS